MDEVGFAFGISARMLVGALACLALLLVMRKPLLWHKQALQTYLATGIGIYGAMMCVYWGAQYVPSGLVSVMFGFTPILTGLLAGYMLAEQSLTPVRWLAMLLCISGLFVIFSEQVELDHRIAIGMSIIIVAVVLHSLSTVLVKKYHTGLPALSVTTGGLLVALPFYFVTWLALDGHVPESIPLRSGLSILYLGVVGSGIGFVLFFYVLKHVPATTIGLLPLITPVLALIIGSVFNGEVISAAIVIGTSIILVGLLSYQFGARGIAMLRRNSEKEAPLQEEIE
jgi:drug/metabolite transporter (DMT)-like permease